MKKILFLLLLIIVACTPQQLCNSPYIEFEEGECCLDSNTNNICDINEKTAEKEEEEIVKTIEEKKVEQIIEEEKKIYDLVLAKRESLQAAKDYFREKQLGLSPAYIFESENTNKNIYTLNYKVKYLKNLDEFEIGYLKTTYDLDKDVIVSVKFTKE